MGTGSLFVYGFRGKACALWIRRKTAFAGARIANHMLQLQVIVTVIVIAIVNIIVNVFKHKFCDCNHKQNVTIYSEACLPDCPDALDIGACG